MARSSHGATKSPGLIGRVLAFATNGLTREASDLAISLGDSADIMAAKGGVVDESTADGAAETIVDGATAFRNRVAAILELPEAKERGTLATYLALNTELSADEARRVLGAAPAAVAPVERERTRADDFRAVYAESMANPADGSGPPPIDGNGVDRILRNYRTVIGQEASKLERGGGVVS
jgi:hypothetical protein